MNYILDQYIECQNEIDQFIDKLFSGEKITQLDEYDSECARKKAREIEKVMNGWFHSLHREYCMRHPGTMKDGDYFCYEWLRVCNLIDKDTGYVKVKDLVKYVTQGLEED